MKSHRIWRVSRIVLLWILSLPTVFLLCCLDVFNTGFFGEEVAEVAEVTTATGVFPAAPRTAAIPLYTTPNGRQLGEMTWWEYFDPTAAQHGWLRLDASATSTTERLGGRVGNWVRLADLTFELRDVARLDARLSAKQRCCARLSFADVNGDGDPGRLGDWNADGQLEVLKIRREDNIFDAWDVAMMYGTPQGKPTIYLDLTAPEIMTVKQPNGATVFTTRRSIWNGKAYCWRNGRYRYGVYTQDQRRMMIARFWRDAWSLHAMAQRIGFHPSSCLAMTFIPAYWFFLFWSPWVLRIVRSTAATRVIMGSIVLALLLMCLWQYQSNGFRDATPLQVRVLATTCLAMVLMFMAVTIRCRGSRLTT